LTKYLNYFCDKTGQFNLNLDDFIVRTSIITHNKDLLYPNPTPLPVLTQTKKKETVVKVLEVKDLKAQTMRTAIGMASGLASIIGLGCLCPDPAFLGMTSIFALAVVAG